MSTVPEDFEQGIDRILRNLNRPAGLSAPSKVISCLISKRIEKNPALTQSQAVKEICTEVLECLRNENQEYGRVYADILQGRFWENISQKRMISDERPTLLGESNFSIYQRKAISQFKVLIWEKEQACKREMQAEAEKASRSDALVANASAQVTPATNTTVVQKIDYQKLLIVGLLVLVVLLITYLMRTFLIPGTTGSPGSQPLATGTAFSPTTSSIASSEVAPTAQMVSSSANETQTVITPTPGRQTSFCGETDKDVKEIPFNNATQFLRHQGVAFFDTILTSGGVLNDYVRAVAVDTKGVWFGYQDPSEGKTAQIGLSFHDGGPKWVTCNPNGLTSNKNINDIAIDKSGKVFVTTDNAGVLMWDGKYWHSFTPDTVPVFGTNNQFFKITIDKDNIVWVGSAQGVARFDGVSWTVPYSLYTRERTISDNRVHVIAFSDEGDIWVGHVNNGISFYSHITRQWTTLTTRNSGLGGNEIRDILIQKQTGTTPKIVWVATADGGITKYEWGQGNTFYNLATGFLANDVPDLAIDRYQRLWAATAGGTTYFDGRAWVIYDTLPTLSIAFSPVTDQNGVECVKPTCAFDNDHIWTGTTQMLTHTRIPFKEDGVSVTEVCFERVSTEKRVCLTPVEDKQHHTVIATYPDSLKPGEKLLFEITVMPLDSHTLGETHHDFLSSTDEGDENPFGAHWQRTAIGETAAGQKYTFAASDNPFTAPNLDTNTKEQTFTSTWRVWMWTRYTGPYIRLVFTVK